MNPLNALCLVLLLMSSAPKLVAQYQKKWSDQDYQRITVFFTNDVHGGVVNTEATFINPEFPPIVGGGASAARYINSVRHVAEQRGWGVLLLDQGDIFQGTLLGTRTGGRAMIDYMNLIRYDAMAVGNHDFDLGKENLMEIQKLAEFPFLAANIVDKETGELAPFVKPYIVKDIHGIRIGILGLGTRSTLSMSYPAHVAGLDFLPEIPTARKYVKILREQEKCDFVILSTHAWLDYNPEEGYAKLLDGIANGKDFESVAASGIEIAHFVPGLDMVLTGHVHRGQNIPWEDPDTHTLVVQSFANSSAALGHINLYFDRSHRALVGYDFDLDQGGMLTLFRDEYWPDQALDEKITAWQKEIEKGFDDVIGRSSEPLTRRSDGESLMGNLVADAMLAGGAADMAVSNYGGVRAEIKSGDITARDVFKVMPFDNRIVVMKVSGAFIKELLEDRVAGGSNGMLVAGARVVVDKNRPDRERVTLLEIGGKPYEPDRWYNLAVSDYLAEGNSGFGRLTQIGAENVAMTGLAIRDAIIKYVQDHTPLEPRLDGRFKIIKKLTN